MKTSGCIVLAALFIPAIVSAQSEKNLAETLGYPRDSKLLIIHADDMGLSHSVNTATMQAFSSKSITSGSIMVPCPWANEMTYILKKNPDYDAGIHLDLTAEWDLFKWDGVSPSDQIKSLLDQNGFFYPSVEDVAAHADAAEAQIEMVAQIDRAISMGVRPSHLDTHMGSVMARPELLKLYLSLSEKYNLPVLFPREYAEMLPPDVAETWKKKIFLLDNLFMLDAAMAKAGWMESYREGIQTLKPGLNQIIVHLAVDNDEMRAICTGHEDFGSEWRQNDLDIVQSEGFKELLKQNNVILVSWGQISEAMKK